MLLVLTSRFFFVMCLLVMSCMERLVTGSTLASHEDSICISRTRELLKGAF